MTVIRHSQLLVTPVRHKEFWPSSDDVPYPLQAKAYPTFVEIPRV